MIGLMGPDKQFLQKCVVVFVDSLQLRSEWTNFTQSELLGVKGTWNLDSIFRDLMVRAFSRLEK